MLRDRDDVGAGDFGNGDATVGFVRCIEIDVVGANAGCNGKLELLGFCKALGSQVARVETGLMMLLAVLCLLIVGIASLVGLRCGDDNLSVYELLVELGVLAFLVRGRYESMSLVLKPFAET